MTAAPSDALSHVLAVDLSQGLAGSFAATLLEGVGARVIRLGAETKIGGGAKPRLGGPRRPVRLPEDDGLIARAVAAADVLVLDGNVASIVPGWDDERLRSVNPRLIHASIPHFPSGSDLARIPADETVVAAYAGIYGDQGGRGAKPVFLSLPICSYAAAVLTCCGGVTSALLARGPEDGGQGVEVSLFSAALAMQARDRRWPDRRSRRCPAAGACRRVRIPCFGSTRPPTDSGFCSPAATTSSSTNSASPSTASTCSTTRVGTMRRGVSRREHFEDMTAILAGHFGAKPARHWLAALEAADIPVAPVLTREQFLDHPQVVHNGIAVASGGRRRMGTPVAFSASPGALHSSPSDPEAALAELSERELNAPPPAAAKRRSAPLDGVTVVSFAMYIAGASAASLLADLGARVIKVEPPHGDPFRTIGGGFQAWNRGVQCLGLDLSKGPSRDIVNRLTTQADVVIENFRVGMAEKLAVDYATLSQFRPDLVYCSMTGYGDDGPYANRPAFDPLFQAQSGLMQAEGGQGRPPIMLRMSVSDHMAGMLAPWAVVTALLHRRRTGAGQRVSTNLLNAIVAAQAGEFFGEPVGRDGLPQVGASPLRRIFEASDGWLLVSAEDQGPALCRAVGESDGTPEEQFIDGLESRFRAGSVEHWLATLRAEGVRCARADSIAADLMSDPQAMEAGVVAIHESAELGEVRQPGLSIGFSETPGRLWGSAPGLGEHTDGVLGVLGFDDNEVAELRRQKVVV